MTDCRYELPTDYAPVLDRDDTERAIKIVKDCFQTELADGLQLRRVTAPLFVEAGTGVNDDLNGVERPVAFHAPALDGRRIEIVQSLAKWKRLALADLGTEEGHGIYTDMNAIRPDEALDSLHSLYVDQWDWERVMSTDQRTLAYLEETVRTVYRALKSTEEQVCSHFAGLVPELPHGITFVHAEEIATRWPELAPRERENAVAREHGAVFIVGIGAALPSGAAHDGRAPDYDDWITPNGRGRGLNGDIVVWHPVLGRAVELSSMGIRVSPETLLEQLEIRGCPERRELAFHRRLLAGELPQSIGGGIGQSRLCTLLLRKAHIGEIQAGLWPEAMRRQCTEHGIPLL